MKFLAIVLGAIFLASCSSMGTSGAGGASGASGMSSSEMNKPYSQRVFDPNDPYHGG